VEGSLRPSNAKRLYMDEKSTEIKEQNNRKVNGRKIGKYRERRECVAALSDIHPSTYPNGPTRSIKTPASIAIRVIEVHTPIPSHTLHHEKVTVYGGERSSICA